MSKSSFSDVKKTLINHKKYKRLNSYILITYCVFISLYMFRPNLYALGNDAVDLIVGAIPNFIPSVLFSIIGIYYLIPFITGKFQMICESKYLLIVSFINLLVFILIEYIHVILELGNWDNIDILATVLGILLASIYHFRIKEEYGRIELNV